MAEQEFVSVKEAAVIAGVTDRTIRNWIGEHRLSASRPGSDGEPKRGSPYRIALISLRALLSAKPDEPKGGAT